MLTNHLISAWKINVWYNMEQKDDGPKFSGEWPNISVDLVILFNQNID